MMSARKHGLSVFLLCLMSCGGVSTLWAQQSPAPVPVPAPADSAEQAAAWGWALLERALNALALFNEDAARSALEELAATYPEHPASAISAEALATLQARATSGQTGSKNWGPNGEER